MADHFNVHLQGNLFYNQPHLDQTSVLDPDARSFKQRTAYISEQIKKGEWRVGCIRANECGLTRDLPIFLASRKTNPIVHDWHGDRNTYCPPLYWDLAIGSGPCGLGCRGCYLLGTFRDMRDPHQPLIYNNYSFLWEAVRKWLTSIDRRPWHSLGIGTDRSDSLLFEHITGHARHLIPMFADPRKNPRGCMLLLLTKSKNIHYLEGLPTSNVMVSFSLNPESIADLWEGKWSDTMERITPPIDERLTAALEAQEMGFEIRWRIDPILTLEGWENAYQEFLSQAADEGHRPTCITLGTFRENMPQLDYWRNFWGLPAMEWRPEVLRRDGTHYHSSPNYRINTYKIIAALCKKSFPDATVSLCKETRRIRQETGLCSQVCNCLADKRNT
ncbi:MAG: hypothetical protein JSV03_05375 [Planctomycetota bacterium]|nr:MAG: hypothetical protein JSV03_05375 [Planctomycetota bacterium]